LIVWALFGQKLYQISVLYDYVVIRSMYCIQNRKKKSDNFPNKEEILKLQFEKHFTKRFSYFVKLLFALNLC